jgi:eukaryotic-like serine/threonine-protein kinase
MKENWIEFRGHNGSGYTHNSIRPPLAVKWKLRLQIKKEPAKTFNPPVIIDNVIYFGSMDGNFYALDVETGYMRWVFRTKAGINSIPSGDEKNVYFGSNDGTVYAVSRTTGEEVWSYKGEHTIQSTIVSYKDYIIFTEDLGSTVFLSKNGNVRFTLENNTWLRNAFLEYQGVLYLVPGAPAGSGKMHLGAYDVASNTYLWYLDTDNPNTIWYSFSAIRGKNIHYSTASYYHPNIVFRYYALNKFTGEIIWRSEYPAKLGIYMPEHPVDYLHSITDIIDYMSPGLWNNLVIYTSGDTIVRAFNITNGNLVWQKQFDHVTSSSPTIAGNRVYFGLRGDPGGTPAQLICLSASNGTLMWKMDIDGAILAGPVISGRWIVFGTDQYNFYVLEELF